MIPNFPRSEQDHNFKPSPAKRYRYRPHSASAPAAFSGTEPHVAGNIMPDSVPIRIGPPACERIYRFPSFSK
jgi:hypothetical protein